MQANCDVKGTLGIAMGNIELVGGTLVSIKMTALRRNVVFGGASVTKCNHAAPPVPSPEKTGNI